MYDLQKASLLKRLSAYILDLILLLILSVGFMTLISLVTGYDDHARRMQDFYTQYEEEYGIDIDMSTSEYEAMSDTDRAEYDARCEAANIAMNEDEELLYTYNLVINLSIVMMSLGILFAYVILDFAVPLMFRNGQTVGKKIFGIGVMHITGVRVSGPALFARAILGKYAVETMVPILMLVMLLVGSGGLGSLIGLVGIAVLQIAVIAATKTNSAIHDLLASTVTVDLASQMIFDSKDALLRYRQQKAAEDAEKAKYF